VVSALSTIIVSYSYQQNTFPIYESLKVQTIESYNASAIIGLLFSFAIYILVSLVSIGLFGNTIKTSVLINFGEMKTPSGGQYWDCTVI
jgi:amino acid permease